MENNTELYDIYNQKNYFEYIVKITEDYLKYIVDYNSLTKEYIKSLQNLQKNYEEIIKRTKNELQNDKYINFFHFFELIDSIPSVNSLHIEHTLFYVKAIDNSITALQKNVEEKKNKMSNNLDKLHKIKNDLLVNINNIEELKDIYFNNLSQTEKAISDYLSNKIKIEEMLKNNNNTSDSSDVNNLDIKSNNLEEQMNQSINESKNCENNYISKINNSMTYKKAFIDSSKEIYENNEIIIYELYFEIKKFTQNILIPLKNCYAIPLNGVNVELTKLLLDKEEKKNIFTENSLKISDIFPIICEKYPLQIFRDNKNSKSKHYMVIEDGIEDIVFIDNDLDYYATKAMFSCFKLIKNQFNINFEVEEQKRATKKILSNILLNIDKKFKKQELEKAKEIYDIPELKYAGKNDIELLYILLDKHYNRVIFLHTLSKFRTAGKYCMPLTVFEIIGKCLIIIADRVIRDEDYYSADGVVILSQTYFTIKDGIFYLHNLIKKHKTFSNIKFWEKIFENSIKNDIIKNNKNKVKNNKKEVDTKQDNEQKQKISDEKLGEIVFGQIASIVNCMIDFELNIKDIRAFIEEKAAFYKLNKNHINNIEFVIENKLSQIKKKPTIENNIDNIENDEQ